MQIFHTSFSHQYLNPYRSTLILLFLFLTPLIACGQTVIPTPAPIPTCTAVKSVSMVVTTDTTEEKSPTVSPTKTDTTTITETTTPSTTTTSTEKKSTTVTVTQTPEKTTTVTKEKKTTTTPSAPPLCLELPYGTRIKVKFVKTLTSGIVRNGDLVELDTIEDAVILDNDVPRVVIPK